MYRDLSLFPQEDFPEKTMAVKEVAEVLNVSEQTIRYWIRKEFPSIVQNGKQTILNEMQITAIKRLIGTGRNDLVNIVEVANISTDLDMVNKTSEVMSWLVSKKQELESENIKLKEHNMVLIPKAEFYDRVTESDDTIDISEVAGILNIKGIGRNKLYDILRDKKILKWNNNPYSEYINRGYFKLVEVITRVGVKTKTVVYQKGLDYIRNILDNM